MKSALRLYSALLRCYPRRFRDAFGDQMVQTFIDHYRDVEAAEGRVGPAFWLSIVADEGANIFRQHGETLRENGPFLTVTVPKLIVSAVLLLPLFAVSYGAMVTLSLALPHPHVGGFGAVLALSGLLLLPGIASVIAAYVLASALVCAFTKRKVGIS